MAALWFKAVFAPKMWNVESQGSILPKDGFKLVTCRLGVQLSIYSCISENNNPISLDCYILDKCSIFSSPERML